MDVLKDVHQNPFIAKEKINVSEFISRWQQVLREEQSLIFSDINKRNAADLQLPAQVLESLEDVLDLSEHAEKLLEECRKRDTNVSDYVPEVELQTLRHIPARPLKHSCIKYSHKLLNKKLPASKALETFERTADDELFAVLTVQIFRPMMKRSMRCVVDFDREIQVLSCQDLTVLRDSFVCLTDVLLNKDYSYEPIHFVPSTYKHEKFGFFLIDNTFYCDTRAETLSIASVEKWAKKLEIGDFSTKTMEETKFSDLTIRLGFPYLYTHKDNCEHLLVFSDVRLCFPQIEEAFFPRCTASEPIKMVKCQMCSIYHAKWLVLDNNRLPSTRFYFCNTCFREFNFDSKGDKIGDFKALPAMVDTNLFQKFI